MLPVSASFSTNANGGRFDHALAALDAVTRYAPERAIILVDEGDLALGGPAVVAIADRDGLKGD